MRRTSKQTFTSFATWRIMSRENPPHKRLRQMIKHRRKYSSKSNLYIPKFLWQQTSSHGFVQTRKIWRHAQQMNSRPNAHTRFHSHRTTKIHRTSHPRRPNFRIHQKDLRKWEGDYNQIIYLTLIIKRSKQSIIFSQVFNEVFFINY